MNFLKNFVISFFLNNHSHKETERCSLILILTWNFGGGRCNSASTYFKIASASWFWCSYDYNWLFYMLDNDNIISASVWEAVEKIPTDEKDYCKCFFMCFNLHSYSMQRADHANGRNSCLTTRIHPVYLKKSLKTFYIKFTQKKLQ